MGTDDSRVVLSLKPRTHLVATDGANVLHPFAEWFQLAIGIMELGCHLHTHGMNLEGSKHLIGVSQRLIEVLLVGGRCLRLGKTLHRSLVDDAQHLTPHRSLYAMVGVESLVYVAQELGEHIGIKADGTIHIVEMSVSAMALVLTIVEGVHQKSVSAPVAGATPKKPLKRSLNDFLSLFKGFLSSSLPSS